MKDDYLTSPIHDEYQQILDDIEQQILNSEAGRIAQNFYQSESPLKSFMSSDKNKMFRSNIKESYNLAIKNHTSISLKSIKLFDNENMNKLKETMKDSLKRSFEFRNNNFDEIITAFESFIKNNSIEPYQYIKEKNSPADPECEVDITTDTEKIDRLKLATMNLELNIDIFKKVFHNSYSFISQRKIAAFSLSNAFVYFITYSAELNPLLPYWMFSITTIIGLLMPSDK